MLIASQRINEQPSGNMSDLLNAPQHMVPGEELQLECWTCGRHRKLDAVMYRFGKKFCLAKAVKEVGWISSVDFRRQRRLAFCSEACKTKALNKNGLFKTRRPAG